MYFARQAGDAHSNSPKLLKLTSLSAGFLLAFNYTLAKVAVMDLILLYLRIQSSLSRTAPNNFDW